MIKADELREFRPQIRYSDGANVTPWILGKT